MRIHWTQEMLEEKELQSLNSETVSLALVNQLMARIARRKGRLRQRFSERSNGCEGENHGSEPTFSPAA